MVVVGLERFLESAKRRVRGGFREVDFRAPAPHHHQAVALVLFFEPVHILAQLVGKRAFVLALFDVRAIEPFHVAAIEHSGHRLDCLEFRADLIQQHSFEDASGFRGLIRVVFENVPSPKHDVVE